MAEHTPGPWFPEARTDAIIDIGPERCEVASIFGEHIDHLSPKDWANANLIAAAPDMLAALQEIRRLLMENSRDPLFAIEDALVPLDFAVTKALGRHSDDRVPDGEGGTGA